MKFENDAKRIAMIVSINSIIGNLLLSLGKLIAGFVAQSAAMVSDGIHSASDVFGTLIVMAGVKFSNKLRMMTILTATSVLNALQLFFWQ